MSKYVISSFDRDCPPGHKGVAMDYFGPMLFVPLDMEDAQIEIEVDRAILEMQIEDKKQVQDSVNNDLDKLYKQLREVEKKDA